MLTAFKMARYAYHSKEACGLLITKINKKKKNSFPKQQKYLEDVLHGLNYVGLNYAIRNAD